jgi:uncharacterized protein YycO
MKIALYKGKSLTSRAIRFLTRSNYSHAAFLFDEDTEHVAHIADRQGHIKRIHRYARGSVIEAWEPGGVRNTASLRSGHDRGVTVDIFAFHEPLIKEEERALLFMLNDEIGWPYDFTNVLRFVTKRPGNIEKSWFCSELVFAMLKRIGRLLLTNTEPWEVPPDWIARSPKIYLEQTVTT